MANKDHKDHKKDERIPVISSSTSSAAQEPNLQTNEEATIKVDQSEHTNLNPLPSKRLSAEQEAGRAALERKHSPEAKAKEKAKKY